MIIKKANLTAQLRVRQEWAKESKEDDVEVRGLLHFTSVPKRSLHSNYVLCWSSSVFRFSTVQITFRTKRQANLGAADLICCVQNMIWSSKIGPQRFIECSRNANCPSCTLGAGNDQSDPSSNRLVSVFQLRSLGPAAPHVFDVSLTSHPFYHTWLKWSARHQALQWPDKEPFIWIGCVGGGKHWKHVGWWVPRTGVEKHWVTLTSSPFCCCWLPNIITA